MSSPCRLLPSVGVLVALLSALPASAQYVSADQGQRPAAGTRLLPEQFLRGYDPVTAYFESDLVAAPGPADDGPTHLKISPAWPGAWHWVDRRTLQFRPGEPWPALARFSLEAKGARRVLTTMMSAPASMSPAPGSTGLRPFRTLTLSFPQALTVASLKQMVRLEIRDLPGLADSPRRRVTNFALAQLPRATHRDPATYALTLDDEVPEGKVLQVDVSLALGSEEALLWTGRLSTRPSFHLATIRCGGSEVPVAAGGSVPKDMALACGNSGDAPQLLFSAPVQDLTLTALKKLVRLEPSVPDLHFQSYGSRVLLKGRFVPDVLYKMTLGSSPVQDDSGRQLKDPGHIDLYFHLGWRSPFLRLSRGTALLEANGPRMVPLAGYGDARADLRIYRVDPLHSGLWPFPENPVLVDEESSPPFPGEEPGARKIADYLSPDDLQKHIRLLGSPLVSKVIDLPLGHRGSTTSFGVDLGPLLDDAVGRNRPGTYLVGLRRLTGAPQRAYARVQITNLSLTAVEERDRVVLHVRTLDRAEPVHAATITLEGTRRPPAGSGASSQPAVQVQVTTDERGRAELRPLPEWQAIHRLWIRSGEDLLVLDPREPPPRFANNHWSPAEGWLQWLTEKTPAPANDQTLAFLFSERGIYRPGDPVLLKGFVRRRRAGQLQLPESTQPFTLAVTGPDNQSWAVPLKWTPLGALSGEFKEPNPPSGLYTATLSEKGLALGSRTFKIEAYRLPIFELQLTGAPTVRLDAPFKVKAVARYFAGGSVSGQPIAWSVTRRPYHHIPRGRDQFLFASSTQFAREGAPRRPEVLSQEATLDEKGAHEVTINPTVDLDGSARIYRVEATVTGPDNQPVTAVQELKGLPPFVMGMRLQRYAERAKEIRPEIIALGGDDKPVIGQEIMVRLYKRVWHSNLRETHFSTGEAKYTTEQEDVRLLEKSVSTQEQPVIPALPISEGGVYVVELWARDKLGRVQTLSADLYVGGQTAIAWQKSREGVFELTPDKKLYAPGDTAHLLIQSPYQSARALVVVEEPSGNRYSWKDVSGGKAVFEVPLQASHVPNLPVHVVLMRGRLGEGKLDDSRYRPATVAASIDLEVEPVKNRVSVQVEHPEVARPGSTVELVVNLRDEQRRPLAGEVTLWLVDEAVLSLAKEPPLDPLSRFIVRNERQSAVRDSRNLVLGRLAELEESPGGDGSEEEERGGGKRVVRKNFKTVPYYAATLSVPASGRLVVPVKLADDLTNFRVRAVAVSGPSRFGLAQSTLRVRLPIIAQPMLPRFVRQGDRFSAGAIIRLVEGAEGPASAELRLAGPVDAPQLKTSLELKADRPRPLSTPVVVRSGRAMEPAQLTLRGEVTRASDQAGDAFEVKIPILPDRGIERFAYFDTLADGRTTLRPLPEAARPGTTSQLLHVTSEPGVLELASALEYLSSYPHGCLEQRMSILYPDLALAQLLRALELDTRMTPQLLGSVRRVLEDFEQHQDAQGLFAFWPGGPGDVSLTAQAVEFMVLASKAGLAADEKVRSRAQDALRRTLRSDYPGLLPSFRLNQQTEALRALTRAGQLDEHYLIDLFHQRANMDPTALADLASAMSERPATFQPNLAVLKDELWDRVTLKLVNGRSVLGGIRGQKAEWNGYLGSSTSTVAAVFEGLLRLDPSNARHDQLRDALLSFATPQQGFGSTHSNRRAAAALGTYLERARQAGKAASLQVSGGPLLRLDDGHRVARASLSSEVPSILTVTGGPVGVRVAASYLPKAPGEQVSSLKQGLIVSRSMTHLPTGGGAEKHWDDQAGATRNVALGDVLELHTRLTTDEERHHVALVVPFAAGLEPLNPNLETTGSSARPSQPDSLTPSYVQRLDQETRYYFTLLPKGTHAFHFRVRAATEGSFVHPAPFAELMYRQEIRGRGEGMRVLVGAGHERSSP